MHSKEISPFHDVSAITCDVKDHNINLMGWDAKQLGSRSSASSLVSNVSIKHQANCCPGIIIENGTFKGLIYF